MPSCTVRIPDYLRTSGYLTEPLNTSTKARLNAILSRTDITLEDPPLKGVCAHASIWINAAMQERLERLGKPKGLSIGETITALLAQNAKEKESRPQEETDSAAALPEGLSRALQAMGMTERPEQTRFYRALQKITGPVETNAEDASRKNPTHKVLVAEAGTGIGKTLAYLASAHEFFQRNKTAQICVAVPSHALMDRALRDWRQLMAKLDEPITTTALIGQGEFVSVQALQAIVSDLDDVDEISAITTWIDRGGPGAEGSPLTQRWTISGLRHAAPTFKLSKEVTLNARDDDEDPGFAAYRAQWARLPESGMVMLSHAMLASLTWRRLMAQNRQMRYSVEVREAIAGWHATPPAERENRLYEIINAIYAQGQESIGEELIPNFSLLIVDEAHQLEDAFALVLSTTVSMWSLRRDIAALHAAFPRAVLGRDVAAVDDAWGQLRSMGDADRVMTGELVSALLQNLAETLSAVYAKRPKKGSSPHWRRLGLVSNSLRLASATRSMESFEAMVTWSPDRKWPQITMGRLSHAREANYLWTVIAERSILVSGTLYEEMPQLSCENIRRSLAIPYESVLAMEPVHARWQFTPVTACIIAESYTPGGRAKFVRPKTVDDDQQNQTDDGRSSLHALWCSDVATYIHEAYEDADGGMLVLGTAFKDLREVARQLSEKGMHDVLVHQPGLPLSSLRNHFLDMARNGKRPILLAAGAAWTGFDIYDPDVPNAVTDLVMLNAPFGAVSRTLARELRLQRNLVELAAQVTVLVRQGLGRLVRSPNTPENRRVHWLDARIHQPGSAALLNPVRRVLAKYRQIAVS